MPSPNNRPKSASVARASVNNAHKKGDFKISDPVHSTFTHRRGLQQQAVPSPTEEMEQRNDGTWPRKSMPVLHTRSGSGPSAADSQNRMSLGPSILTTSISSVPSKSSLVQRKPAGLRATIKRMFGSKRQRQSAKENFHLSDAGNLITIEKQTKRNVSQGSSRREMFRSTMHANPLGSHDPATSFRSRAMSSSDQTEPLPFHKRRNTLPSLVLSDNEAQTVSKSLDNYMAPSYLEQARAEEKLDLRKDKRRSRSAEALTYTTSAQHVPWHDRQDRSAEIAYWRNSVVLNPLPLVNSPVLDDRKRSIGHGTLHVEAKSDISPINPAQTFDFGLSNNNNNSNKESTDLEERVNTLEVKMVDFEYAIAKLQGVEIAKPGLGHEGCKRKSIHALFPSSSHPSLSTTSSYSNAASFPSQRQSPLLTGLNGEPSIPDRSSKVTIRPAPSHRVSNRSLTPSPSSFKLSREDYNFLMAMLQDEKVARQHMEMQIMDLRKEVQLLQAPVYATIRPLDYPTPTSDGYSESPLGHRSKPLHRSPRFEFDKTPMHDISRFSMDDSEVVDSDGNEETYQTPRERHHAFDTSRMSPLVSVT